jgi:hypothetical protein
MHIAQLFVNPIITAVEFHIVHAVNAGEEGLGELSPSLALESYWFLNKLTKIMVTTVNSIMDLPCLSVSFPCLTASYASTAPARCCLKLRRSRSLLNQAEY